MWWNTYSAAKSFISCDTYWGPLSDIRMDGMPCLENIAFIEAVMLDDVMELSFCTSMNHEKQSTTRRYCEPWNSNRSNPIFSHGCCGSLLMIMGSFGDSVVFVQWVQFLINSSISLATPGHHTDDTISRRHCWFLDDRGVFFLEAERTTILPCSSRLSDRERLFLSGQKHVTIRNV